MKNTFDTSQMARDY